MHTTMPRPKKKPPKSAEPAKAAEPSMKTHGLRMTAAYSDWLERYARSQRVSVAALIDRALADDAERRGFPAPPERTRDSS